MALLSFSFFSEELCMQTNVQVVMPQKVNRGEIGVENSAGGDKYKCLYLLHGLSDDQTIWARRTSIERYATKYGICIVMPFAERSFYADMKYGLKYYSYLTKELPEIIEDTFNVSKDVKDRYVGGLSMGGYGALKMALRESGRYAACFGLSSVADVYRFKGVIERSFGDGEVPENEDLFKLVKLCKNNDKKPRIYMTVGTEDFMYQDNLKLKAEIEALNCYDYTFVETKGGHCWELWDVTVQSALEWMLKDDKTEILYR